MQKVTFKRTHRQSFLCRLCHSRLYEWPFDQYPILEPFRCRPVFWVLLCSNALVGRFLPRLGPPVYAVRPFFCLRSSGPLKRRNRQYQKGQLAVSGIFAFGPVGRPVLSEIPNFEAAIAIEFSDRPNASAISRGNLVPARLRSLSRSSFVHERPGIP
jgi:hypothetical protein